MSYLQFNLLERTFKELVLPIIVLLQLAGFRKFSRGLKVISYYIGYGVIGGVVTLGILAYTGSSINLTVDWASILGVLFITIYSIGILTGIPEEYEDSMLGVKFDEDRWKKTFRYSLIGFMVGILWIVLHLFLGSWLVITGSIVLGGIVSFSFYHFAALIEQDMYTTWDVNIHLVSFAFRVPIAVSVVAGLVTGAFWVIGLGFIWLGFVMNMYLFARYNAGVSGHGSVESIDKVYSSTATEKNVELYGDESEHITRLEREIVRLLDSSEIEDDIEFSVDVTGREDVSYDKIRRLEDEVEIHLEELDTNRVRRRNPDREIRVEEVLVELQNRLGELRIMYNTTCSEEGAKATPFGF